MSNFRSLSSASSSGISKAKNKPNKAPADEPEISIIFFNLCSCCFRHPINANIPIDDGPIARYSMLSLNKTEEIAFVKQRRQVHKQSYEQGWQTEKSFLT